MSDEAIEKSHDGWASRKAQLTLGCVTVPFITASVAWLALGKMDAAQWTSFVQTLLPLALGLFAAGNVAEKFAAR